MRLLVVLLIGACTPAEVRFPGSGDGVLSPVFPLDAARVPMSVALEPTQACGQSSSLPRYQRRASAQPSNSLRYLWSSGVIVGDLDGDGLHDLVAPSEPFAQLYRGTADGGAVSSPILRSFDLDFGAGGSLADVDGDGDLDMLVVRFQRSNALLRNDGDGQFTDITAESGLDAGGPSTSSAWADMDRDGDLDLFVARYGDLLEGGGPAPSLLYENVGRGIFVDRSSRLPDSVQQAWTRMAGWHDFDLDGYPELVVVNDLGDPSVLLWNIGGAFVEDDGRSGLGAAVRGAGLGVGDVNGDGIPDMLVSEWGRMSLLESAADDMWVEHAAARGLLADPTRDQAVPWGAELVDLNNDGLLDAMVAFGNMQLEGDGWNNPLHQPDAVYLQQEDGSFSDAAEALGMADRGIGRGFVAADVNRDGVLDVVKRDLAGSGVLYLSECTPNAWLRVKVDQRNLANRFGVGTTVRLWADGRMQQRTVVAGGTGFGSGGPPELHFGLGAAERVDRLEVIWPDGTVSDAGGFEPRREVRLTRD
jgi:enediyne biosynthesis protein E4